MWQPLALSGHPDISGGATRCWPAYPGLETAALSLPGENFGGLQLMCLMFAGFNRVAPEADGGMALEEPFLTALELHQKWEGQP